MNTPTDIQSKLLSLDDLTPESTEASLKQLRSRIDRNRKSRKRLFGTMLAFWFFALACPLSVVVMRHIELQEKQVLTGAQPTDGIFHGIAVDDAYPFEPDARVIAVLNVGQYVFLLLAVWLSVVIWRTRPPSPDAGLIDLDIDATLRELEDVGKFS